MPSTYTPIATTTLGSAQSSVTFSSIAGTYTDLVLVTNILGVSATTGVGIQFNSDTGSNYSVTSLYGDGTSAGSTRQSSVASIRFSLGTSYRTTNQGIIRINIQNYSNSTTYKSVLSRNDISSEGAEASVGLWRSTSAITAVKIIPTNNASYTFSTGSTFTLWGIQNA